MTKCVLKLVFKSLGLIQFFNVFNNKKEKKNVCSPWLIKNAIVILCNVTI